MTTCLVAECGLTTRRGARGMCHKHYEHWRKYGEAVTAPRRGERHHNWRAGPVTYRTVHSRLVAQFGPASDFTCIDCDEDAYEYAYQHDDADEIVDARGRVYTTNLKHYEPMCRPCHSRLDRRF